ncbi:Gll4071 protein [Piscinibacter sakaiensis]|uniref:Gll4071 protein n=2 Tax=Piscinibacter sakaiensis TaxID=1547922 RepID=A0A0K8P1H6_PISS1|nr:Gll4071 protein [Piscinibacter sakaiensis]
MGPDEPGGRAARDRLFELLYNDLHRLAHSRLRRAEGMTSLHTTALVHESYLRLQGVAGPAFPDRDHFLSYAAKVMRSIVIDVVRARQADRRGGGDAPVTLDTGLADRASIEHENEVLRVHEALEELAAAEPRLARVVELRYFVGLSEPEIAEVLGVTERTVQRDWQKARLFLSLQLA